MLLAYSYLFQTVPTATNGEDKPPEDNMLPIAGAAVGGLIIIGLIIALTVVVLRRNKQAAQNSPPNYDMSSPATVYGKGHNRGCCI